MTLQKIIDTASKYPWRYGFGNYTNDPLAKLAGTRSAEAAAKALHCELDNVYAFNNWWDSTLERQDGAAAVFAVKLQSFGYTIPAGPRLIRARRKTKRVRAYQYLRSL